LVVFRLQVDDLLQLLESAGPLLRLSVGLRELVMRFGEAVINMDGAGELNRSLLVFAFFEVAAAALKIFLLANVGIT